MANGIIRLDDGWRLDDGHHLDQPPNIPAPVVPPRKRRRSNSKSNSIIIMADYVPSKREQRKAWLQNIKDKADAQVVAGGGTAPVATNLKTAATAILTAYGETDSAKTSYEGAKAVEADTEATQLANIRSIFTTLKVLPTWKPSGADAQLQSSSSTSEFDPGTYKPEFTVTIKGGLITLNFKKKGVDALAIYARLRGTLGWTKIGIDTSSPYIDARPLAVPGVSEVREYMGRGMIDDEEIGLESDIVSISYAG
jgi:hypothetical protein